jgi:hypothetical protein
MCKCKLTRSSTTGQNPATGGPRLRCVQHNLSLNILDITFLAAVARIQRGQSRLLLTAQRRVSWGRGTVFRKIHWCPSPALDTLPPPLAWLPPTCPPPHKALSSLNLVRPGLDFTWLVTVGEKVPPRPSKKPPCHPGAVAYPLVRVIGLNWPQMRATREAMYLTPCRLPPLRRSRMADASLCDGLHGPMVLAVLTPRYRLTRLPLQLSSHLTLRHYDPFSLLFFTAMSNSARSRAVPIDTIQPSKLSQRRH